MKNGSLLASIKCAPVHERQSNGKKDKHKTMGPYRFSSLSRVGIGGLLRSEAQRANRLVKDFLVRFLWFVVCDLPPTKKNKEKKQSGDQTKNQPCVKRLQWAAPTEERC